MDINFRKIILSAVTIIVAAGGYWYAQSLFSDKISFDEQLIKISEQINQNCPMVIDSETRLDNTIGGPGKMFMYNYTLVNMSKDEIDIPQFKTYIEPRVINNARTNNDMRSFRDNKVEMVYKYFDKNGVFVFDVRVLPDHY
jgi:hypothetical protein